ncbi:NADH-quinone oxidoreductase subunit C [Fictibacillus enclensis]|uniref:NADH-quinone oxidoreductase subunit C n=1 Tax=Fictibacillus enclensis TaxID=1017270 RepID=UPI0025A20923|nr:NADH-quinone oxidoreductase subunit C [Fictibacillus enclensis]MDM5201360.1 NADH-quinone oxidoreductase subunit C [Fictibacillus enclensis]
MPNEHDGTPPESNESLSKEDLKKRAAAEAKAKALELAKQKALEKKEESEPAEKSNETDDTLAKDKALAAAKAKAAAAAKAKAAAAAKAKAAREGASGAATEDEKALAAAKAKAAAAAKAKAAAAAKAKAARSGAADSSDASDEKAKAIAAAKAKAAAAARAKAAASAKTADEPAEEQKPSPLQPLLDKYKAIIQKELGDDALEDSYINLLSKDVPTLVAQPDTYFKIARLLKHHEELRFDYLSELHATDFETHLEVYTHFYSYSHRCPVALKVKINRKEAVIDSLAPLWAGADWPEREAFDLIGITFNGHPNLTRIMMPDDWIGHPLRKDYEPYDVEV